MLAAVDVPQTVMQNNTQAAPNLQLQDKNHMSNYLKPSTAVHKHTKDKHPFRATLHATIAKTLESIDLQWFSQVRQQLQQQQDHTRLSYLVVLLQIKRASYQLYAVRILSTSIVVITSHHLMIGIWPLWYDSPKQTNPTTHQ